MTPTLNWREISAFIDKIRPEVKGLFVDRIVVPERAKFPNAYIKGEWSLRLTGRKQEAVILFSIRPKHPYIAFLNGKGPKASAKATHSPFDLNLSKHLKGSRLLEVEALYKERIVIFWFSSNESSGKARLGLVLFLIPAVPEAFLVLDSNFGSNSSSSSKSKSKPDSISAPVSASTSDPNNSNPNPPEQPNWPIVARSRTVRDSSKNTDSSKNNHFFRLPSGSKAPENVIVRPELIETSESLHKIIEKELLKEAFQIRWQNAEKALRALLKQAKDRLRQSETAQREAEKEQDWKKWGDLLKSSLGSPPELIGKTRTVIHFESGEPIAVPCDPKLSIQEQVEKFYQNARRKQRRISEAQSRSERFRETLSQLNRHLSQPSEGEDWAVLDRLERASNTRAIETTAVSGAKPSKKAGTAWLGKSFNSADGMPIWVGRDKDENLELTFKCARGNDLWMHIRGKPGAHVLIPLQSGKSAPLETLLDAAHLALHYSGGAGWGKTEVDYTFKKYVKRIKDSTEASYTNNKTLLINPDRTRIKKLLDQIGD
jgi:predicted ribosome quality control (RQC) complex YloA/Tae2 family protein